MSDANGKILAFVEKGESIPVGIKLYNNGKIPIRKTSGAACYDCFANEAVSIAPGARAKIRLGFGLELPYSFEAIIRPRSGFSLRGIDAAIGTIDEDFKSEISAIIINNSDSDFKVNIGDRICQMAIRQYERYEFEVVDELSETDRGEGGFGSTGV
jgi:dUTP pyrophosphatase